MNSTLGRAGIAGLGKAVEVLDTLGSSMVMPKTSNANRISILAFEFASTIVRAANLMQSLSKDNIAHLKEVVLPSVAIQNLISTDMDQLLSIAMADKREELRVLYVEIVRFGQLCKDPKLYFLENNLEKLGSRLTPKIQSREKAESVMQKLMILVQYTAELYHELHILDKFEQEYRQLLGEDDKSNAARRRDNLAVFLVDLKSQRKHIRSLKRKSLWHKIMEEVTEKLVDIAYFLHLEIHEAFGSADSDRLVEGSLISNERLGPAGLALHYAVIVKQINALVSRGRFVPQYARHALYERLPKYVKSAFRSKLWSFQVQDELTVAGIKYEMDRLLQWLVPIATNTTKAHHGFSWVREWAYTGSEVIRKPTGQTDLLRIETLHHAYREKTEAYILELVIWLHHLDSLLGQPYIPIKYPIQLSFQKTIQSSTQKPNSPSPSLTLEDEEMLRGVKWWRKIPGISRSQNFDARKNSLSKHDRLTKSTRFLPMSEREKDPFSDVGFDTNWIKALDVIDRVDTIEGIKIEG